MKIDVSDLLKEVGAEQKIELEEKLSLSDDGLSLVSPVKVKLRLLSTGSTILATGNIKAIAKLECSRCLKAFDMPINVEIAEEYAKKGARDDFDDEDKEDEIELKDDYFVCEISEHNIIDLDEAIRQNLIVTLPMKVICSKDCKVPVLKKEPKKVLDPRLAKLKEIRIIGGK